MGRALYFMFAVVVGLTAALPGEAQTNAVQAAPKQLSPQTIALVRNPAAPFGAGGSLELQLSNSPAGIQLVLTFDLEGLTPGTYRVEGLRRAGGIPSELGELVIPDPDATPDIEAGGSRHEDSTTHQSEGVKSRTVVTFPVPSDISDMRYIRLTDRGGTVFLEGRLRNRSGPG